jgi:hypothetical protein
MAARNHFEWAKNGEDDGFKVGLYSDAIKFRMEAVNAEKLAKEAEGNGDSHKAWLLMEEAKRAAYEAAKAEDERR